MNNVDDFKSELEMTELRVESSSLSLHRPISSEQLNISVTREIGDTKDDNSHVVKLSISVSNESSDFDVSATVAALFTIDSPKMQTFLEINAVSILFPFLRSCIAQITAVPGMTPIVIPPINVAEMLKQTEAQL